MKNRYTLGERVNNNLYVVLRDGKPTEAVATKNVKFENSCEVYGGEFHGGIFHKGRFYGGEFRGGLFFGGEFHGGRFHGGLFFGGEFHGGRFHGGRFHRGSYKEGWLHLQIQGSGHFVNIPDGKNIKIGCQEMSPEEWLSSYKEIGEMKDYTDEQIKEYKRYIDIATAMIEENKQ